MVFFKGIVADVAISFFNICYVVNVSRAIKKPLQVSLAAPERLIDVV